MISVFCGRGLFGPGSFWKFAPRPGSAGRGAPDAPETGKAGGGIGFSFFSGGGAVIVFSVVTGPVTGEVRFVGSSSEGTGEGAESAGFPQDSQNFAFPARAPPHAAQTGGVSSFAPQDSQNFIPGTAGVPH